MKEQALINVLLRFLDDRQLLDLYEHVLWGRVHVVWPLLPEEEEQKQQEKEHLNTLHALILSQGFDRHLGYHLWERYCRVQEARKSSLHPGTEHKAE
jgi:hypothetical protein